MEDANSDFVLGVDVGGTKINVGYVTREGAVLSSRRYKMDRSTTASTLDSIYFAVTNALNENKRMKPLAIGFGLVGRCDPATGVWVRAVNLPIPAPIDFARNIRKVHGLWAFIDNDVYSAAKAELSFGAGRRHRDFVVINIGTGLSIAIVSDGRLVRGAGNMAGEVGRTTIGLSATSWSGKHDKTLENCCSGGGMIDRTKADRAESKALMALQDSQLHSESIFRLAKEGDHVAKRIADDAISGICEASACFVSLFNPDALVFAGSVACHEGMLEAITEVVNARAFSSCLIDLKEICLSDLDAGTVGLIGAAQNAWQGLERRADKDSHRGYE